MALFLAMKGASAEHFGSTWAPHCDRKLWDEVARSLAQKPPKHLSSAEARGLRDLSVAAGGWWVWRRASSGPAFVPMGLWLEHLEDEEASGADPG